MIRKFFAGFFIFIFITLSFPFVLFFGIYETFFDRDFYQNEFIDIVYDFSIQNIPEKFPLENLSVEISKEEFADIFKEIFTKDDLRKIIDNIINQLQDLKVSEDKTVKLSLSLNFINEKRDVILDTVSEHIIDKLPNCEAPIENIDSINSLKCIPEGMMASDLKKEIKYLLDDEMFKDMENEIILDFKVPDNIDFGNLSKDFNALLYKAFFISIVVLFFILVVVGLIIFSPLIRVLKWEAKALFLASFFNLVIYLSLIYIFSKINFPEMEMFINIYSFFIKVLSESILYYLVPIAVFSFVLWIIGIIYDKDKPVVIK